MPALSRWFIRASLVYLVFGFTLGGLLLSNKGLGFYPPIWRSRFICSLGYQLVGVFSRF